ncbi:gustatory receptor for sugar taste 64f-like [Aricia agestis]|uniref:gustatory receptor for sugar taste 64f-like n=1 Tax=Aricia agestis TaxID=91739 RepID=UPI001C203162|nr:gustatory receptor for sugar taste 64f-like [Aricia agestis]
MTNIYHYLRWLGIAGGEKIIWKMWGGILVLMYLVIEIEAVWKVIKALAGWAITLAGTRSITARLAGTMFYTGSMIGLLLCWRLASSWKDLAKYWYSIEGGLNVKCLPTDYSMSKKMYIVTGTFLICSIFEHILSIIASSELDCPLEKCLRTYVLRSHGFLLLEHEYRDWMALPLFFMSNLATLIWNVQDLIIVLMSMGLSSRYKRLNQCVAIVSGMVYMDEYWCKNIENIKVLTWRRIREEFVNQAKLVRRVDTELGPLILASNFFNLYFICLQLFLGFTRGLSESFFQQAYYFISFFWFCFRTGCSVLAAANVNRSSTLALSHLYQCTPQFYNVEIQRLQKQLTQDYVALSGVGFYSLSRTLVLQMAAAVFTYVLVLIQYDDSGRK